MYPLSLVFILPTKSACIIRLLKLAPTNQEISGIAASVSEEPANIRTQNNPYQYLTWINSNQQVVSNVVRICTDLKCEVRSLALQPSHPGYSLSSQQYDLTFNMAKNFRPCIWYYGDVVSKKSKRHLKKIPSH